MGQYLSNKDNRKKHRLCSDVDMRCGPMFMYWRLVTSWGHYRGRDIKGLTEWKGWWLGGQVEGEGGGSLGCASEALCRARLHLKSIFPPPCLPNMRFKAGGGPVQQFSQGWDLWNGVTGTFLPVRSFLSGICHSDKHRPKQNLKQTWKAPTSSALVRLWWNLTE